MLSDIDAWFLLVAWIDCIFSSGYFVKWLVSVLLLTKDFECALGEAVSFKYQNQKKIVPL